MEIARAFGLAFLVLSAITAVSTAIAIVVNLIIGDTQYIFGNANHDMGVLSYILVAALIISVRIRWRKSAANPATVSQTDQHVG